MDKTFHSVFNTSNFAIHKFSCVTGRKQVRNSAGDGGTVLAFGFACMSYQLNYLLFYPSLDAPYMRKCGA